MASLLVGVLFTICVVSLTPVRDLFSRETAAPPSGTAVDLEQRIATFTRDVVADARYRPPDSAERTAVAQGVSLYLDGKRTESARRLAEVGYGVRVLTDGEHGRRYAEIADRTGKDRERVRGWGRVYIALGAPVRYSVQVPHPVADAYSDLLGAGVLRGAAGGLLVIAGAHRNAGQGKAADVAHRRDTVFDAVCAELTGRRLPGIQVHGFADASSPAHDVVVSTGAGDTARPQAVILARALEGRGFRVCRTWEEKSQLAGVTNTQGRFAAEKDVPFLHVEVSRTVRADKDRRDRVVAALASTAGRSWTATAAADGGALTSS